MKLYELTEQYNTVYNMALDEDADMISVQDTLEGLEGEIEDKAENIAKLLRGIDADVVALKAEEDRLYKKRAALESKHKGIKLYLESQMMAIGKDKIKGTVFTLSIQNNVPSLNISEDAKIPKMYYIKQDPQLDKRLLLSDVKEGKKIKGVELKQSKSLRIR